MASKRRSAGGSSPPAGAPEPVDVVDGIPDRSARGRAWKLAVLAGVFVAWVAFLIYCALAGAP